VTTLLAEQPLVLHDRVAVARPGRPLKLRARLQDRKNLVTQLVLHYRPKGATLWTEETFQKGSRDFTVLLRDPDGLAPAGVRDEYVVEYFVSAHDAEGLRLDAWPREATPVPLHFSNAKADAAAAEAAKTVDVTKLELRDAPPPVPVATVPPDETPWYLQTWALVGGGVVVVGGIVTAIVLATRPPPPPQAVGQIHLGEFGWGTP